MSNTTNDSTTTEETAPLPTPRMPRALSLQRTPDAEDAKALGQPIGVYGEGKYGECRWLTKEEIAAQAHDAEVPGLEKTEA